MNKYNSLIIGMGGIGFKYDNFLSKSYKITHLSSQQAIKEIETIYCFDKNRFQHWKVKTGSRQVSNLSLFCSKHSDCSKLIWKVPGVLNIRSITMAANTTAVKTVVLLYCDHF